MKGRQLPCKDLSEVVRRSLFAKVACLWQLNLPMTLPARSGERLLTLRLNAEKKDKSMEERILIIWLGPDGSQRICYEMAAGDMVEASRIFADMVKVAKEENSESRKGERQCT